jgi:hypothetical protein
VNEERNVLSQAFATLSALRLLVLAYVAVNCVLAIFQTWYTETLEAYALYALHTPFGAVFGVYFYSDLVDTVKGQSRLKLFGNFLFYYLVLLLVCELFLSDYLYSFLFAPIPTGLLPASFFLLGYFLVSLLPYYFFATVLPAQIFGKQTQLLAAPWRAARQFNYLFPRYTGIYFPIWMLGLYLLAKTGDPDALPIDPSGEVNFFSFLLLVVSQLVSVLTGAIFMVLMARVYLKDLREQGEIPAVEVEVFA